MDTSGGQTEVCILLLKFVLAILKASAFGSSHSVRVKAIV